MKIRCQVCGKMIDAANYNCPYCRGENPISDGEITTLWLDYKKKRLKIRMITIISVIAAAVLTVFILDKNLMLSPKQYQALMNTKAIKAYAKEHYPNAVLIEKHYNSIKDFQFMGIPKTDVFIYELDGLRFTISACKGECDSGNDGYETALIKKRICEKYLIDFFATQGIHYNPDITLLYPSGEISISLDFQLEFEEDKPTPRDFGWFYEFYLYWKEVCPTEDFSIRFCYRINRNSNYNLYCYSSSKFADEDDFYNRFEYLG